MSIFLPRARSGRAVLLTLASLALAFSANLTLSKAHAAPPAQNGEAPSGTIFLFTWNPSTMWVMDPSGANAVPFTAGIWNEPSHHLHGGQRWFLRESRIPGETYSANRPRREMFAVSADGEALVQLTDDPHLEPTSFFIDMRWSFDDNAISFVGQRWDEGFQEVIEVGIYAVSISYDESGVPQPDGPAILLIAEEIVEPEPYGASSLHTNIGGHDWSPDGTAIVYGSYRDDGLYIVDWMTGEVLLHHAPEGGRFHDPRWSPDGSRIAFASALGIETIRPDGSGALLASRNRSGKRSSTIVSAPRWSPDSSHLLFKQGNMSGGNTPGFSTEEYIYRVKADGTQATNITKDLGSSLVFPLGWR